MTDTATAEKRNLDVCPHQIAFILDNPIRRLLQSPQRIVGEYIKQGDCVIDLGCGPGFFSIEMAKMVGKSGKVIAVDLQEQMLAKVRKKAVKLGLVERMEFHRCRSNSIGLDVKADFILAYYMIHETPSAKALLIEMKEMLKPNGTILIVEPKVHVNQQLFESLVTETELVGHKHLGFPKGKGGRSVLLTHSN